MATLAGGEDFSATPTGVTGARLDNHINGATLSNVAQADAASSHGFIVRSASAPSDTDAGWWDTANNVLRVHDGSSWLPVATGALLTNKSGGQVVAGDVIVADTSNDNAFATSTTEGDSSVLGVVAETIAADATGIILYGGIQQVLITGTVNRGEFLKHSTTAKKATSTTDKQSGSFGIALETGTNTTISVLITGVVVSLSAGTAETVTADWVFSGDPDFTGTPTFTNHSPVVQVVNTSDGAVATGTTVMPSDDSIPQNTEGDEYMTLAITPKNSNNTLVIEVVFFGGSSAGTQDEFIVALFQDSTAGALAAGQVTQAGASRMNAIKFTHEMTAGTTSETTFKVRAGYGVAGTTSFNGQGGSRVLGGVMASSITIKEYQE